jgi:cysteinyl-tRNA synthetase
MGDTIDIHAGGEDLTFPHHENEIAQTESLTGKTFVNHWLHVRFLTINGKKMSKSLGNYISFDDVLKNYSTETFRYFYLSVHYRRPLDYTEESMKIAENSAARLGNTLDLIEGAMNQPDVNMDYMEKESTFIESVRELTGRFEAAMDDDLDTHGALDALHAMSGAINKYIDGGANKGVLTVVASTYRKLLSALGLFERRAGGESGITDEVISVLADVREKLRLEKNYALSDRIRDDLGKIGVVLSDTDEGALWKIEDR